MTGRLDLLFAEIEARAREAMEQVPDWPCRRGCDGCCRRLPHLPELNAAEWARVQEGIRALPLPTQVQIAERITVAAVRQGEERWLTCPLLNEAEGACLVYADRPAACRMYGFYVGRSGNRWCAEIEDFSREGMLDGVLLGNHDATTHTLAHRFGAARSLAEWWGESFLTPPAAPAQ